MPRNSATPNGSTGCSGLQPKRLASGWGCCLPGVAAAGGVTLQVWERMIQVSPWFSYTSLQKPFRADRETPLWEAISAAYEPSKEGIRVHDYPLRWRYKR